MYFESINCRFDAVVEFVEIRIEPHFTLAAWRTFPVESTVVIIDTGVLLAIGRQPTGSSRAEFTR